MNAPQLIECSWLDGRDLMGRGRIVAIDGGTLDLGIVRDSQLNSTNDFQIFGQSFQDCSGYTTFMVDQSSEPLFTIDLRE